MRRTTLSSIILWAACVAAGADSRVFQLRNGAVVAGPVLKETPKVFFVDLGYDVMTLPRDQVATHGAVAVLPPIDLFEGGRPPGPAGVSTPTTVAVQTDRTAPPRKFGSVNEMIESTERSVGVVSTPRGLGAGFVISPDGRLLTNFHVVEDERFCEVTLFLEESGRPRRVKFDNAEVLASSALMDIALVKIPADQLRDRELPSLGLSGQPAIDVGSAVFAIGNPGMGAEVLDHSVSEGIVSSRQRNINDIVYVQTTAAVNPGNSGGPLLDAAGRVVGLVTYKAAYQENIAFALPPYYISHFLANEEAYAVSERQPNTGFRYLPPE